MSSEGPSIGVDEWVARSGQRRGHSSGWDGLLERINERVNWWLGLLIAAIVGVVFGQLGFSGFVMQVAFNALLLALLAVGLNIAVGWAGLLDLGYIGFFGFGAYGFALLSSNQLGTNGVHLHAWESLPLVMVGGAILGLVVGFPSRRLIGDYLAIVTLFFGEAFVEFTNNVATSKLGGPNGIVALDPIQTWTSNPSLKDYYYLMLVLLVLTMVVLHLIDTSRTGRAWRAVREDPLAASLMTVPVNRVKLMAFSFGAMVAALAGAVFAAQQSNVFPTNFDTSYLILIYAALILGGAGSMAGAVLGAIVIEATYDGFLRSPHWAGAIFYGLIVLTLIVKLRPWWRLGAVLASTIVLGLIAHAVAGAISHSAIAGGPQSGGFVADLVRHWVIVPADHAGNIPAGPGNIGFALVICLLIALVQLRGRWRTILIAPTIYLACCVWEARLIGQPSITRVILTGAVLIVMMNSRPEGLLGTKRVEIV